MFILHGIGNWLYYFFGVSGTGPHYGFWSGTGSDLSEVALVGALYALLRKHNCHQPKCLRIGRHQVDGTPWCDHHHHAARQQGTDS